MRPGGGAASCSEASPLLVGPEVGPLVGPRLTRSDYRCHHGLHTFTLGTHTT